jgi:hypothetical protein
MAPVAAVREDRSNSVEHRDLEAETAHRINLLVARTKAWRNGSIHSPIESDRGPEVAVS